MTPPLLLLDTRDDRRELVVLLAKLSPAARVAFLGWCCSRCAGPNGTRPAPSVLRMGETIKMAYRCDRADNRLVNEVYADLLLLASQWGLDLAAAAAELERRVRQVR